MNGISELVSHLCGRGRCFVIDGQALGVCQRCLGLYVAAALTGGYLLAGRIWRRGLPSRPVAWVHIALLLVALAGGVHWLDLGPRWRLLCGLWTGHVITFWLVAGGFHLLALRRRPGRLAPWRPDEELTAVAAAGMLVPLAAGFYRLGGLGPRVWNIGTLLGIVVLLAAFILAIGSLTVHLRGRILNGRRISEPP
ncbi:MAG: DUF2085 domain-containing protein [Sedimentisphaerales bacterium]|nr:DUF2085 domain-containing protein [Sedimentisphaerales bacterium]